MKQSNPNHQAVLITFNSSAMRIEEIHEIEDIIRKFINKNHLGEFDGHSLEAGSGDNKCTFYMYTKSATDLMVAINPLVMTLVGNREPQARLRFGSPDSEQIPEIDFFISKLIE